MLRFYFQSLKHLKKKSSYVIVKPIELIPRVSQFLIIANGSEKTMLAS